MNEPSQTSGGSGNTAGNRLSEQMDHAATQATEAFSGRTFGKQIDGYEEVLRSGGDPRIEDYLPADPERRINLLVELLHVDLELRLRSGAPISVSGYVARFPELMSRGADLLKLLACEIQWRDKCGFQPKLDTYIAEFPIHEQPLRDIFRCMGALPPVVPGYSKLQKIDKGGMGVVYRALHVRLNRNVALKLLQDRHIGNNDLLKRFEREGRWLGMLPHANIVQVHDFGEIEGGLPYFALEYCHGGSLAELLKKHSPTPLQAARIVAVLARAVAFAHASGVVHRDLKPGNVLVREPAAGFDNLDPEWLKIADFGMARTTLTGDCGGRTQSGLIMGTLYYMAPEQAADFASAGEPADTYSLGVMLYEMLVGHVPFRGQSQREILRQIDEKEPMPPSRLVAGCPKDLEIICLKCLEKNPALRYVSATSLAEDLEAFLDGRPIGARPVGKIEKVVKWIRRHPAPAMAWCLGALLLMALFTGPLVFAAYMSEARQIAQEAAGVAKQERDRADARTREVIDAQAQQVRSRLSGIIQAIAVADIPFIHQAVAFLQQDRESVRELLRLAIDSATTTAAQTRLGYAALLLGDSTYLPVILKFNSDPTDSTAIIQHLSADGVPARNLIDQFKENKDPDVRSHILIALGDYKVDQIKANETDTFVADLLKLYALDSSAGVHGAIDWLLKQNWGRKDDLDAIEMKLRCKSAEAFSVERQWFVNSLGMTLSKCPKGFFRVGDGVDRGLKDGMRDAEHTRTGMIGTREVTVGQWRMFAAESGYTVDGNTPWENPGYDQTDDFPVSNVTWNDCQAFFTWLSKKDGRNYRLPTEMEWEHACRAGTETSWSVGRVDSALARYSQISRTNGPAQCGRLRPNRWGIFDMHGNTTEWCQDAYSDYPKGLLKDYLCSQDTPIRVMRGGSWYGGSLHCRSAVRHRQDWIDRGNSFGFRVYLVLD